MKVVVVAAQNEEINLAKQLRFRLTAFEGVVHQ